MEKEDCVIESLLHRGYGKEEGCWNFTEPMVMLWGKAQAPAVSHTLAISDALWGESMNTTLPMTARAVKLELTCRGTHIAINRSRRPGVGPGRCDLAVYVDHLKQMGNSRRLCALLDEILPWRRGLMTWVNYLWDRQSFGRGLTDDAASVDYAGRLMKRLLQVLAQTNGLPLLLLQFPPIAHSWQQEFMQVLEERNGTTVAVFMDDVNQMMGGLFRAMQMKGEILC